jgi:Ca2+-binding RTX toxin-like protein
MNFPNGLVEYGSQYYGQDINQFDTGIATKTVAEALQDPDNIDAIKDNAFNILSADGEIMARASIIFVTDSLVGSDIEALMQMEYADSIDLAEAFVVDSLTIEQANFVKSKNGIFDSITDSAENIINGNLYFIGGGIDVFVVGELTGDVITALAHCEFADTINLSLSSIVGSMNVDQATFVFFANGSYSSITDTALNLITGDTVAITEATTIVVVGEVTAEELNVFSASIFANEIELTEAKIVDALSVDEAVFVNDHQGSFQTIAETIGGLLAADQTTLALANTVMVIGEITAEEIYELSNSEIGNLVDLSESVIIGQISLTDAIYALTQKGEISDIYDTAERLLACDDSIINQAINMHVVGDVTPFDVDEFALASYEGVLDFSDADITESLAVEAAQFVALHQGRFLSISDNALNLINADASVIAQALTIWVTGEIDSDDLTLLISSEFADKIELGNSYITEAVTIEQANFIDIHNGVFDSISDSYNNIIDGESYVVSLAADIHVIDEVTPDALKAIAYSNYADRIDLSNAIIDESLSVELATYVTSRQGKVLSVTDSIEEIALADLDVLSGLDKITANDSVENITAAQYEDVMLVVTDIEIIGTITAAELNDLSSSGFADKVSLRGASITETLSVEEAEYTHAQKGIFQFIKDSADNISAGDQDVVGLAVRVFVEGDVTSKNIAYFIDSEVASILYFGHASILESLTVEHASFVVQAQGIFDSITDTADNLIGGSGTDISQASTVFVVGEVTAEQVESLSFSKYADRVDLENAFLLEALSVEQASYAFFQQGIVESISDDSNNIINAESSVLNSASIINITGDVTSEQLDSFSISDYATAIDLSLANINDVLTVFEAEFASSRLAIVEAINDAYAAFVQGDLAVITQARDITIADTVDVILTADQAILFLADSIFVTGEVTGDDLYALSKTDVNNLVDLSVATIVGPVSVEDATYAVLRNGDIHDITDNVDNLLSGDDEILNKANAIHVLGDVTASDIAEFSLSNYQVALDLSESETNDTLTVEYAEFVVAHQGSLLTIKDRVDNLNKGDASTIGQALSVGVLGNLTAKDLDLLIASDYVDLLDLSECDVIEPLTVEQASFVDAHQGVWFEISDTTEQLIEADPSLILRASLITVDDKLTSFDIDDLAYSDFSDLIDLSQSSVTDELTVDQALFVADHNGIILSIRDTITNISASPTDLLVMAERVSAVGDVLAPVDLSYPSVKFDLSGLGRIDNTLKIDASQVNGVKLTGSGDLILTGKSSENIDLTMLDRRLRLSIGDDVVPIGSTITLTLEQATHQDIKGLEEVDILISSNINLASSSGFTRIDELNGNGTVKVVDGFFYDITAPAVSVKLSSYEIKAGDSAFVTFIFSEAPVDFGLDDIRLNGSGFLGDLIVKNNSSGLVYEASYKPIAGKLVDNNLISVGGNWMDSAGNYPVNTAYSDYFKVNTLVEDQGNVGNDLNKDGIADSRQANVAVFNVLAEGQSKYVALSGYGSVYFTEASVISQQDLVGRYGINLNDTLPNAKIETDIFNFTLVGSGDKGLLIDEDSSRAGTQTSVTIYFSDGGIDINRYYKLGADGLYDFTAKDGAGDGAVLIDSDNDGLIDKVVVTFTDNAIGDDNEIIGVISDPGFLAYNPVYSGKALNGTQKRNNLSGGDGDDILTGAGGNDLLYGGGGRDTLKGGLGKDQLYGEDGNDILYGNMGDDTIEGGRSNDYISGDIGKDKILGGVGNDTIHGGLGKDKILGGQGSDSLTGGKGIDSYIYNGNIGQGDLMSGDQDIIYDNGFNILRFSSSALDQMFINGNNLGTFTGRLQLGNDFNASSNISFNDGLFRVDVDANGVFDREMDFSIKIIGQNTITFNGEADLFLL